MPSHDDLQRSELKGDRFGAHRVLVPRGALPQAAERVDNDFSRVFDTEILLDVDTLNLDAASFRQMFEAT
jgi:L-erythro-3,5-diaminohexanoate dehydrogenase